MNNRPKDPKTARNKNVLVIGGSGSGKTRFFVKPNLMQCVSKDYPTSFVITDPKGSLIGEVGQLLIRSSYRVKVLNTINFSKSMKYNPFRYLHSEKDVLKLVNTLICNTKGEGEKSAEDFWVKSERLFYTALIGYIWQEAPEEEMNFTTLLEMINASEAREDDPEFQSPVDLMFERLEERDPDHFAVRQYKKFLLSAGKTRSSILISAGARMAPFDIREVRELMLFEKQYTLTQTIETETRYRTETRTDSEGNTYTVQVPYTYYICNVKLENFDMSHLPVYIMGEEQMSLYAVYMHTLGNRPDLFPNGTYPNASTVKEPTYYDIPPEALEDATFAAMMAEAEKYVGYPYVWGGSSPSTSFDCSGFVSWVINHSGWDVGRLGAQGLCNICTPVSPEQAKPGDLVFFVGTYDTPGVSHVGIYVGNSVMLHCGDPISYTNLNSSYWQQHFYCYGRLP